MSKSTSIKITAIVLALAVGGGAFFVGWLMGNDWQFNRNSQSSLNFSQILTLLTI